MRAARVWVGLSLRLLRGEVVGTVVVLVLLLGAAGYGIWVTQGAAASDGPSPIDRAVVAPLVIALWCGIAVVGSLLGAGVGAGELESGTARLAWTMMDRRRWLACRALSPATLAICTMAMVAIAFQLLSDARHPGLSTADMYGTTGWLPPLRVLLVYTAVVVVGLVVGKVMAAMALGCVAASLILGVLSIMWPFGVRPLLFADGAPAGSRVMGTRYRTPDGTLLTRSEAEATAPGDVGPVRMAEWLAERYPTVTLAVTPDQLAEVVTRETIVVLGGIGGMVLSALVIVDRKRPA